MPECNPDTPCRSAACWLLCPLDSTSVLATEGLKGTIPAELIHLRSFPTVPGTVPGMQPVFSQHEGNE